MKNGGGCKEKDTSGRRVEIKRNVTKIWPVYLHVIQRWVRDQKTLTPCVPQTSYYTSKTSEVEHESHLDQVVHCLPPRSQYLRPFIDATTTIFNIRSTYCCWFSYKLDLHTGMVLKKMWLLSNSHFTRRISEDEHRIWRSLASIPLAWYLGLQ